MRQLVDLFNTSDARSILKKEHYEVDPAELVQASEKIVQEWQKLINSNEYDNFLHDTERYLYKVLESSALDNIIYSLEYDLGYIAEELINEFGFRIKTIEDAKRKQKLLRNWFRLYEEKHPKKDEEEKELIYWEDLKANAEYVLKHQIDYNCTVIEYLAHEKIIKRLEEQKRKLALNGKED